MTHHLLPTNLQLFAGEEEAGDKGGQSGHQSGADSGQKGQQSGQTFDYERLAGIISGKQNVAEQTILKNYFKEQGLSKEEAESAINAFKEQKRANEPDLDKMQQQIQQAQTAAREAVVEKEGILLGIEMGLEAKSVPYVLKLADTSEIAGEDGKVDQEALKKAINQVLEDVPALKPDKQENTGIHKLGSGGSAGGQQGDQSTLLAGIFGNAK
jgi:hypothetical protein